MAFHHAAFRQDLPATPANLPLNYVYPPPGQSSYTPQQEPNERVRKMWEKNREWKEEQREREREEKEKEDLYNSVIDSYIIIEYVKQHYQDNKKSQNLFVKIQYTITILQILGVAVIYFNYSYSVCIFLGVFYLDMYEQGLIYKREVPEEYNIKASMDGWWSFQRKYISLGLLKKSNYKLYNYFRTEAINHYGKGYVRLPISSMQPCDHEPGAVFMTMTDDMVEKFKKDLDILDKPNKTAKQFYDRSYDKYYLYYILFIGFCIIFSVFGVTGMIVFGDKIEKENYFPNERKNHTDTEIAFKYIMFIIGSLFIVLKLIVRYIIINLSNNHKIDMSPLFVKQPSERQPLLTNTIV